MYTERRRRLLILLAVVEAVVHRVVDAVLGAKLEDLVECEALGVALCGPAVPEMYRKVKVVFCHGAGLPPLDPRCGAGQSAPMVSRLPAAQLMRQGDALAWALRGGHCPFVGDS